MRRMEEIIENEIKEHIGVLNEVLSTQGEKIKEIARLILDCYKNEGKVILFGNGGSAADAQHIAAELVGRYKLKRKRLIKNIPENNSLIIKKHNQRKLHKLNVEEMIKAGYYKNPEFD